MHVPGLESNSNVGPAQWFDIGVGGEAPADTFYCDLTAFGSPIMVARAWIGEDLIPGYAVDGLGYFPYKGRCVIRGSGFSVLRGANYQLQTQRITPLQRCVSGGWSVTTNEHLYVGAMFVSGCLYPGELRGNVCTVAVNGFVYSDINSLVVAYSRML